MKMPRLRVDSEDFENNDYEISPTRSRAGSSVSGKSETFRYLNDRLRLEAKSRRETDELYQHLQQEYDNLLTKHAEAENTIDQLRIGAKINLYSDPPVPHQASQIQLNAGTHQPLKLSLPRSHQAIFTNNQTLSTQNTGTFSGIDNYPVANSSVELDFLHGNQSANEKQLQTILRLRELQGDIEAFQSALGDRELDYIQQRNLFRALANQHDQLKSELQDLKTANQKETKDVEETDLPPQNRRFPEEFVAPDSLEGEIYRIGLKLEEISDEIGEQLNASGKTDPLNQVLKEDFENLKRLQPLSGTRSVTLGDKVTVDAIVENVIQSPDYHDDVFSSSEGTNFSLHGHDQEIQTEESGRESSVSSCPYVVPSRTWEPGVEDLTESAYYPTATFENGVEHRRSVVGSQYLARSPSTDYKVEEDRIPRSRSASESRKSVGNSSVGQSPIEILPSSRCSIESIVCRGQEKPAVASTRPKDFDIKSSSSSRDKNKRDGSGSVKSNTGRRISSPHSNQSGISYRSNTPKLTSSPKDEARSSFQVLVSGKSQRYSNTRPGSDGRRSNDRVRSIQQRKDGSQRSETKNRPRSLSGEQNLGAYEDTSSSERDSSLDINCQPRPKPQTRGERTSGKMLKDQNENHKPLRPNTADSYVDSGFVGSEDSRRSQRYIPDSKVSINSNSISRTVNQPIPRTFMTETRKDAGTESLDRASCNKPFHETIPFSRRSSAIASPKEKSVGMQQRIPSKTQEIAKSRPLSSKSTLELSMSGKRSTQSSEMHEPVVVNKVDETIQNRLSGSLSSTGERYRYQLDKLRERMSNRSISETEKRGNISHDIKVRSPSLSTVEEGTPSYKGKCKASIAPKSGRHNETQTKMTDRDSEKSEGYRYSLNLMRDEIYRLRSQLNDESRLRELHAQLSEDLNLKRADLERSTSWKLTEERQRDMLNDLRRRLDKLTDQVQRTHPTYNDLEMQGQKRLYDEVRGKLDGLTQEIQRSRSRILPFRGVPGPYSNLNGSDSFIHICPVCSGTGYHRHGHYVFPRDFITPNSSVRFVPTREVISPPFSPDPIPVVTSTPVNRLVKTAVKSPLPSYRISSPQPETYYASPNTVYHIHKHHKSEANSSSSEEDSGSEIQESKRKRRSPRGLKNRNRKWDNSELQDFRLNQSLDEATKAAKEMQRVSKKMLSTLATDLIQVGYDEY